MKWLTRRSKFRRKISEANNGSHELREKDSGTTEMKSKVLLGKDVDIQKQNL